MIFNWSIPSALNGPTHPTQWHHSPHVNCFQECCPRSSSPWDNVLHWQVEAWMTCQQIDSWYVSIRGSRRKCSGDKRHTIPGEHGTLPPQDVLYRAGDPLPWFVPEIGWYNHFAVLDTDPQSRLQRGRHPQGACRHRIFETVYQGASPSDHCRWWWLISFRVDSQGGP